MNQDISAERMELLRLRARIAVLERASMAALELALRLRPEELAQVVEVGRKEMALGYQEELFTAGLHSDAERQFVASEAERLIRSLQAQLGFPGGVSSPEVG
ncbi:hypothetical protein [Devosia sp. 1566]|uniref:hypothetical protein n=1 Tax=Devosia sp. 1566 TaxID=2499144 RepID=UPI000FD7DC9F|nr:hypothetical protein [Devosia sp. 1566]